MLYKNTTSLSLILMSILYSMILLRRKQKKTCAEEKTKLRRTLQYRYFFVFSMLIVTGVYTYRIYWISNTVDVKYILYIRESPFLCWLHCKYSEVEAIVYSDILPYAFLAGTYWHWIGMQLGWAFVKHYLGRPAQVCLCVVCMNWFCRSHQCWSWNFVEL